MTNVKNKKIKDKAEVKVCTRCNPQMYLKFSFSFVTYEEKMVVQDYKEFHERMKFLSSKTWSEIRTESIKDKKKFIEMISVNDLGIRKEIPKQFRNVFPPETNEKYAIFRIYPNNNPKVARVIGMIKNTIFYVFYIDGDGSLYKH